MKATIRIERTADPNTNLYRLSYPGKEPMPGTYHHVGLRGATSLTLSASDGSSRKALHFPSLAALVPGEAVETNEWTGMVLDGQQWIEAK